MGWTIKEAAKRIAVDPATWADWEKGASAPCHRAQDRLCEFLTATQSPVTPMVGHPCNRRSTLQTSITGSSRTTLRSRRKFRPND